MLARLLNLFFKAYYRKKVGIHINYCSSGTHPVSSTGTKANPSQSLVSGHTPTQHFEKPIYYDYNNIHSNYDLK